MAVYFLREDQRGVAGGPIPYTLLKDGKPIQTGTYADLYNLVRQQMQPSDIYQETGFDWCLYEQMVENWAKDDAFERGA